MKIAHSHSEGFFVSFCDVLFALMTIFVFLMIIVATQVKSGMVPRSRVQKVQQEMSKQLAAQEARTEQALREARMTAENLRRVQQDLEEAEKRLSTTKDALENAIATREIELVIVVDTSASMGTAINGQEEGQPHVAGTGLRDAMLDLAASLPELTSGFHVGIIGYREGVFPFQMTQIFPDSQDGGRSRRALYSFLQRQEMQPTNGPANITDAVAEGARWLASSPRPDARKVLAVIGDMGPYELPAANGVMQDVGPGAEQRENQIRQTVLGLAAKHPGTSLLMLYATPTLGYLQQAGPGYEVVRGRTMTLFRQLAFEMPDKRGRYTEDTAAMLGHIALAILAGEKR